MDRSVHVVSEGRGRRRLVVAFLGAFAASICGLATPTSSQYAPKASSPPLLVDRDTFVVCHGTALWPYKWLELLAGFRAALGCDCDHGGLLELFQCKAGCSASLGESSEEAWY